MKYFRIWLACAVLVGVLCLGSIVVQTLLKREASDSTVDTAGSYKTEIDSSSSAGATSHLQEFELGESNLVRPESVDTQGKDEYQPNNALPQLQSIELTDFRGQMKKGRLAQRPTVDLATHPSLPWFTKDATTISFPNTAENTTRNYFYAWVQLNPNLLHKIDTTTFDGHQVEILDGWNEYRRARLPRSTQSLEQLLEHDAIVALGNKPISEKLGPNFQKEIAASIASDSTNVYITLMSPSDNDYWQKEIENIGAVIEHWDPTIRVLVASVPFGKIVEIAGWDFVQSIEPMGTVELMLDSAVPVSGADGLRLHTSVNGSFTGITGQGITVGVMDSGLNLSHPDIYTGRDSICGESFMPLNNGQPDNDDLWVDVDGHGTHVTGILAGSGVDDRSRAGMAPGVSHLRVAKVFSQASEGASFPAILKAMDYFTQESSCDWDGSQSAAERPQVINMSLGSTTADAGYQTSAKKLDWAVWNYEQVYTVSQGNERREGYSQYASAKNSISVAWLTDASFAAFGSSFGPVSDGRMSPNVGMSGDRIYSAEGYGTTQGYVAAGGTSMSSPAVAGVVALLMSADDNFKNNPALVRAHLMATAIKPDAYFADRRWAPSTNTNGTGRINHQYGLGAVSARTAITQGPNDEWSSHSAVSEIDNDEYAYIEIDVPPHTDRLDIVLTWDEPANDNVGDAVMADLDLYLGPDRNCDVTQCGDFSSRSRVDNLEYLVIFDPEPGTQRITVLPHNVFQFEPKIAVSWMFNSNSTPQLDIEVGTQEMNAADIRRPQIDLSVSVDESVAAAVALYIACRNPRNDDCDYFFNEESRWQPGSRVVREDGTIQDLSGWRISGPVMLGEVISGEVQDVRLVFPPSIQTRSHQLYFSVASANAHSDVQAVDVIIDDYELPPHATKVENNYATNAIELTGESGSVSLDLAGGARQPGEMIIDTGVLLAFVALREWSPNRFFNFSEGYSQSRSAWYKIPASPTARKYEIQLTSKVPEAANITFQLLAADNMFLPPYAHMWTSDQYEVYLQPDKDYYLRINTYWWLRGPEVEFTWQQLDTKPVNDDFDDRTRLTGRSGERNGNNAFATVEHGEPGGHISIGTTWYRWRAPADGVWSFAADALFTSDTPQVYVYTGNSVTNLRLVSDSTYYAAHVPVVANQEYQICVAADAQYTSFQGSYELTWEESSESRLMSNDLFEARESFSGEEGKETTDPISRRRTVELNEPDDITTHSLWWEWNAPSSNDFTFRVEEASFDTLSVFIGSRLSTLSLQETGTEFVLDARSGQTFYFALHRQGGLEYSFNASSNSILWGVTPEHDRINRPDTLRGTSGTATYNLTYATTTPDESAANGLPSIGVHSSVWGSWTTPDNYDGWMKFSIDTWEEIGLEDADQQPFLGIYKRNESDTRWNRVASTDRSYIISGKPEAMFKPESSTEYLVQVARRTETGTATPYSNDALEVDITWAETSAPSWLSSNKHFHEIGSPSGNDIPELIEPIAGTVVGIETDRMAITLEDEILVLAFSNGAGDLEVVETIPYRNTEGNTIDIPSDPVVRWNSPRQTLYIPRNSGFLTLEGLDQSSRAMTVCEVEDDFGITPLDLLIDDTGRFLYKIGSGTIATYRIDGPCELSLIQVISSSTRAHPLKIRRSALSGLETATFGPNQSYIYASSNLRFLTFARDEETGELNIESDQNLVSLLDDIGISWIFASDFYPGQLAVDPSGEYLILVGPENPAIAIFDITDEPEEPKLFIGLHDYYGTYPNFWTFPSHIRKPIGWYDGLCQITDVHNTENPTIEVFCRSHYYVATYDKEKEELYLTDWSSEIQPDRFGNRIPVIRDIDDVFMVSTKDGQYSYLVVDTWIDSIHRFERVTGANTIDPPVTFEPYDEWLIRLVAMDVEPGEIELGSRTIRSCEPVANAEIDNVTYTVLNSKWQVRESLGAEWSDVEGTERDDNQLCPYAPTDDNDYRLVFEAEIDDVTDKYSSDVMVDENQSSD